MYRDRYNVDVLLFLEHKDRELEVVIEIANILKNQYGLTVGIASITFHKINSLCNVRPKVIVFPSNNDLMRIFYAMYGSQVVYVNLNWEQMLSVFNKVAKMPSSYFMKNILKQCAWGEGFKRYLVESNVREHNIFITGKPLVTLLKRKALNKIEIKQVLSKKYDLSLDRKWLFFPMTCLHAFSDNNHLKRIIRSGLDESMVVGRRDYVNRTLSTIFKWIADVDKKIDASRFLFILRPHPSIAISQYERKFREVVGYVPSHVFIIKDLNAHEWLFASEVCYTNYSSLALDAAVIKKMAYLLEPEPFPKYLSYEWFDAFKKIKSFDEFYKSILENNLLEEDNRAVADEQFNIDLDGISETATLLNAFAAEIEKHPKPHIINAIKSVMKSPRQPFGSLIRLLAIKLKMSNLVKAGLKYDYVDRRDIALLLNL